MRWLLVLPAVCAGGCTLDRSGMGEPDAGGPGPMDAGTTDTGVSDSGTDTEATDTGPTEGGADGEAAVECGNGVLGPGEACDGVELGGKDCVTEGYSGGTLSCSADCALDTSGCTPVEELCGNGQLDPGEACDGAELGGEDCESQGYITGTLACTEECTFDRTLCVLDPCGNGVMDLGEQCDGPNLAGQTCESFGLSPGTLTCTGSCTFDLSGCPGCGNGLAEGQEVCDGADLKGRTCNGGLDCTNACLLDGTSCTMGSAGDGSDGDLVVNSTVSSGDLDGPSIAVTSLGSQGLQTASEASAFQAGDEVLLLNMQGDAANCGQVGTHEFLRIDSVTGVDVTFTTAIQGTYGIGGNADLTGQKVVMLRVPHYDNVTVTSGGVLTTAGWNGTRGGVLAMRVSGELRVEAGGRIHVDGLGYRGGEGYTDTSTAHGRRGESTCGMPASPSFAPNNGGGGGGKYMNTSDDCGQGGGGAAFGVAGSFVGYSSECVSHGADSPADNAGLLYGQPELTQWLIGSGGGAGASDDHSNDSGTGGRGGGLILIFARTITLEGAISAAGGGGSIPSDNTDSGNGGGGSGGAIYLAAGWIDGAGTVTALGGLGAASQNGWNSGGGDGGAGRVRVDFHHGGGDVYGSLTASSFVASMADPDPGYSNILLN